jgi:hypothetical protein
MNDQAFLRDFYRSLGDRPLEPGEAWYVDLYPDAAMDPIEQLATGIEWSCLESTQLLSGFRGTGKSTELRRLRERLVQTGRYKVVLVDMLDYLNMSTSIEISDFLITVAGAFSEALAGDPDLLGSDPSYVGYWERVIDFLRDTDVEITGMEVGSKAAMGGAGLKANLRQDVTFRQRLREHLKGHHAALVADVRGFMSDCVRQLRKKHGRDMEVVLLLDSVEQIRGTSISSAEAVYASVEALFSNHADSLQFEDLHVVYTVPPWLKIRSPGIAGEYSGSQLLPCVRVAHRTGEDDRFGLDALEAVVRRRGDWERLLGSRQVLNQLIRASGGYLRDLFRLLQASMRQARSQTLPLDAKGLDNAIHEVRNGYLPVTRADAVWLAEVDSTHKPNLVVHRAQDREPNNLYNLSRFFDTHMVLCYRNGDEWYDIHPLIREEVHRQSKREETKEALS